jgi:hypothetical protein
MSLKGKLLFLAESGCVLSGLKGARSGRLILCEFLTVVPCCIPVISDLFRKIAYNERSETIWELIIEARHRSQGMSAGVRKRSHVV